MKRDDNVMLPPDTDNELVVDGPLTFPLDRREFVKLTSTGVLVLFAIDPTAAIQERERQPMGRQGYPTDLNAYLHVGADNKVTCMVGKVEYGQGAMTSLAQLLAEELDVPLASVHMVMGDTDLCPWDMGTFGSLSVRQFGPVLRQAGAEARAARLEMAAEKLQVSADQLAVKDGVVHAGTKTITYGELTAGKKIERTLTSKPPLKPFRAYTVVGKSITRTDLVDKVTGKAKYAGDFVPPGGALHARILRPPAHGATLVKMESGGATSIPGVKVIQDGDMVAVLHERWDIADEALSKIKAEWKRNDPAVDDQTIFDHFLKVAPAGRTVAEGGSVTDGETIGEVIEHTYYDSYVAHAPMEPHAATAVVEDGKVTVWASTQTPFPLKNQIMQALRLPAEKVRVITPYVGGGFGGKSASRQGVEAARLATLVGKPVRLQFSREEEFFYDTFHAAAVVKIRSTLDGKGIHSWDYVVYCAGERGAAHFYDIPNHRTVARGGRFGSGAPGLHPFATGAWRAPGAHTNAFAREQHIDVMAAKAGMDPVDFRLRNLKDERMVRVVDEAAKKFGWTPKAGPSRRGVGIACGIDAGTYCALIAEIGLDRATGQIQVKRVVCAQEMGLIVNPDGAKQQAEGCITMGLGPALSEEIHFKGGDILDRNFDSYQLPKFSWLPKIDVTLIDVPDQPSQGGGEPAIVPLPAVIANAFFDLTGKRLFRLPLSPDRVKAALRAT